MGRVLCGVKQSYMFDLLLETRMAHERFMPYKPGGKSDCDLEISCLALFGITFRPI